MPRTRSRVRMLVLLALLVPAAVASAKGLCTRGRFQLGEVRGRDAGTLGHAVLAFDKGTVDLEGICSATDVGRSYYYGQWQYRTRLRLAACGSALSRALVRIRFDYRHECATLIGKLRTRHGRTRFTAHRLPTCGNEVIEDGETCDDGNLEPGDCCDASCQLEAGCSGSCERSADCNPAAVCTRQQVAAARGCPSAPGTCEYWPPATRESICPANPGPTSAVCGCDRRSYETNCEAWAAGIAVVAAGPCPCQEGVDPCPDGYWCDVQYPWNTCDDAIARTRVGACVRLGIDCDGVEPAPVCGCDGITYPNDCARQQARVRALTAGACPTP